VSRQIQERRLMTTPAANDIEIQIRVVDAGSGAVIQNVRNEIVGLDAATKESSQSMGAAGAATQAANNAMRQTASDAGSAEAAMHGVKNAAAMVRYQFSELGIKVPRFLAGELAGIQALTTGMTALSGVFFAVGIASIFEAGIKGAQEFYEKNISVTHSLDEYIQKAGEAAQKELFNTASIETTRLSLAEINRQLNQIEGYRAFDRGPMYMSADPKLSRIPGMHGGEKELNDQRAALLGPQEESNQRLLAQGDELQRKQIESDRQFFNSMHEGAATRKQARADAYARIENDRNAARQLADLDFEKAKRDERHLHDLATATREQQIKDKVPAEKLQVVPPVSGEAGSAERARAYQEAERKAQVEHHKQSQDDAREALRLHAETAQMQREAQEAWLGGEELIHVRRGHAIDELNDKFKAAYGTDYKNLTDYLQQKAAIASKFDGEELKRHQDAAIETAKLQLQASGAGSAGAAKIENEGELKQFDLGMQLMTDKISPEAWWQRLLAVERETTAAMLGDQQDFFQRVNELVNESGGQQLSGFARIRSEEQKQLDALYRIFEEHTRDIKDQTSAAFQGYAADWERGAAAIHGGFGVQAGELAKRNADETLRIEEEARRKSMVGMAAQTQQIEDEYQQRARKYRAERDEQLKYAKLTADDRANIEDNYNRRVLAAGAELEAGRRRQAEETRDKLAGELSGFFKNPSGWLKDAGEKAMSRAAADLLMNVRGVRQAAESKGGLAGSVVDGTWLQSFFGHRGQAEGEPQGAGLGMPRSFWSRFIHPGAGIAGAPGMPGITSHAAGSAASTMSVGTATITISTATINAASLAAGAGAPGPRGALAAGLESGGAGSASTQLSTSTPGYTAAETAGAGAPVPGGASSAEGAGGELGKAMAGWGVGQDALTLAKQLGIKLPRSLKAWGSSEDAGAGANLSGMASGGMGLVGAAMGQGGFGGAMGGAMSGAQFGSSILPGIGTAVGAAGGFVLGLLGLGGRAAAAAYFNQQVRPHLQQTEQQFNTGRMDYLTAYADLQSLDIEARKATAGMGWGGHAYFNDTIHPAILREENKLTSEAKAGRAQFTMSAAQFHSGGWIHDFGDFSTGGDDGFIHARRGEVVIEPMQAQRNAPIISAIHGGLDLPLLLGGGAQQQRMPAARQVDVTLHFHSPDAKGARDLLMQNKHVIRAALNDSRTEYAGGSDLL
jgi:hypothetical protein